MEESRRLGRRIRIIDMVHTLVALCAVLCIGVTGEQRAMQLFLQKTTWKMAAEYCMKQYGGNLLEPITLEKKYFLHKFFSQDETRYCSDMWIGAVTSVFSGLHELPEGSWKPGYPDVEKGLCVSADLSTTKEVTYITLLKTENCENQNIFMCEKVLDKKCAFVLSNDTCGGSITPRTIKGSRSDCELQCLEYRNCVAYYYDDDPTQTNCYLYNSSQEFYMGNVFGQSCQYPAKGKLTLKDCFEVTISSEIIPKAREQKDVTIRQAPEKMPFFNGTGFCESIGGYVLTMKSKEAVDALLSGTQIPDGDLWLGLFDPIDATVDGFVWQDTMTHATWTNWLKIWDNSLLSPPTNPCQNFCVKTSRKTRFAWEKVSCGEHLSVFCEVEAHESSSITSITQSSVPLDSTLRSVTTENLSTSPMKQSPSTTEGIVTNFNSSGKENVTTSLNSTVTDNMTSPTTFSSTDKKDATPRPIDSGDTIIKHTTPSVTTTENITDRQSLSSNASEDITSPVSATTDGEPRSESTTGEMYNRTTFSSTDNNDVTPSFTTQRTVDSKDITTNFTTMSSKTTEHITMSQSLSPVTTEYITSPASVMMNATITYYSTHNNNKLFCACRTCVRASTKNSRDIRITKLKIPTSETSSYRRKKSCAEDNRSSVCTLGSGAAIFLIVCFTLLVYTDLHTAYIKRKNRQNKQSRRPNKRNKEHGGI